MFSNSREIKRINELKLRSEIERAQFTANLNYYKPLAKKVARVSVYALAVKNLSPALRPITTGLIQRALAKQGKTGLFKIAGLISGAIGLARTLTHSKSNNLQ